MQCEFTAIKKEGKETIDGKEIKETKYICGNEATAIIRTRPVCSDHFIILKGDNMKRIKKYKNPDQPFDPNEEEGDINPTDLDELYNEEKYDTNIDFVPSDLSLVKVTKRTFGGLIKEDEWDGTIRSWEDINIPYSDKGVEVNLKDILPKGL